MKSLNEIKNQLNESEELDKELAQITLDYLSMGDELFSEVFYLSIMDRDSIKSEYRGRLPRNFAGPTNGMLASKILTPLVGKPVYVDGQTDLVKDTKTILKLKHNTTWADVKKELDL